MAGQNSDLFVPQTNAANTFSIRLDGKVIYSGNRKAMLKKLIQLQELQPGKNWKLEYNGEHKMIQRSGKSKIGDR